MSGVSAQIHGVFVHPGLGFFRCVHAKPLQSCLTLCDSLDGSPPGCSVCGILQARILEWVAIPFSRGSSQPKNRTWFSCTAQILYHLSHHGSPRPT